MSASAESAGGALERSPTSELADIVEMILDKGVVIDAQISVAVVGIRLLEINARITIASIETYLRFAEAVDRLDINKGLEGLSGVTGGLGGAVGELGQTARKTVKEVGEDVIDGDVVGGNDERPERDRDRERGRDRERAPRSRRERED